VPTAWRIVQRQHADLAFDGEGARRFGGRWNSPGRSVVYLSETRALAMLEILVGLQTSQVLTGFVMFEGEFPGSVMKKVSHAELPADWRARPPGPVSQSLGDRWLEFGESAVLRVPSAVIPEEHNYLINPAHPDFGKICVGHQTPVQLNQRLRPG